MTTPEHQQAEREAFERTFALPAVEEIAEGQDAHNQYCGSSPRCCP